jgi:hypothetical protein
MLSGKPNKNNPAGTVPEVEEEEESLSSWCDCYYIYRQYNGTGPYGPGRRPLSVHFLIEMIVPQHGIIIIAPGHDSEYDQPSMRRLA